MKTAFSMFFVILLLPSHSLLISGRTMPQPFGAVSLLRECECARYKITEKHHTWGTKNYPHKAHETQRDGPPILSLNVYHPRHGEQRLILLFSSLQVV